MTRSDLVEGEEIGAGGQGRVVIAASHPGWVVKFLTTPLLDAEGDFDDLVQTGLRVQGRLSGAQVDVIWPRWPVVEGRYLLGFLMPLVPPDSPYRVRVRGRWYQSMLGFAVPRPGPWEPEIVPTPEQRQALLLSLARFLDALHAEDHVYGDLSWKNCLYRLEPTPTVLPLDLDSIRRVGTVALHRAPDVNTIDWDDPWPGPELAGFDRDRYKFALMVYRMLIAESLSAKLPGANAFNEHMNTRGASAAIIQLLRRAALGAGGRPTMGEWVRVLQ